ncbi:MAG: hypothetical protein AUJ74_01060 [Candidatus Omnitrophica bacterium CG1_02_44_16]|nr:MAG: hypothetical protein AUJ74_01060 [Candidatus Omnitrophica bacterium CG1_02_44_16]
MILSGLLCPLCFLQAYAAGSFDYSSYDSLLKKYVSGGKVDYLKWKKEDLGIFDQYINSFAKASLVDLSKNEQKAFWINTYNALTIYAVLRHIPANGLLAKVFSVQMVSGFFDKITYTVAGETLTLNDIETKKLREVLRDPRIHFALVCASRSCPEIQNTVFTAQGLEERLDEATRDFIGDGSRNRLDRKSGELHLSEIFKWYDSDFIASAGTVIDFVKRYMGKEASRHLSYNTVKIKYLFYDWLVNIKS